MQYHHHHNDNIKLLLTIIAMQYTVHVTVNCQLRWIVYACEIYKLTHVRNTNKANPPLDTLQVVNINKKLGA